MIRYLSSFILTTFLYSICIGVFLYAFSNEKLTQPKKVPPKKISLNHIVLVKKEEPKVLKEEKIIPKVTQPIKEEPKIVKKKIITKKNVVENKPKKIVKKVLKKKEIVKKALKQEPIIATEKAIKTNQKVVHVAPIVDYRENFLRKNLLLIKKQIQKQVKYSKRARRMNIQGNVVVEFILLSDGTIKEIRALKGHRLLRKSTIKAIQKASVFFPKVKKAITIKVPIAYKLI